VTPELRAIVFSFDGTTATSNGLSIDPTFSVFCNEGTWNAVSNQPWLKVSKNDNTFTLAADINTGTTPPAEATVTVTGVSVTPVVFTVTQGVFDLPPRQVLNTLYDKEGLTLLWNAAHEAETHTILTYTDIDGGDQTLEVLPSETSTNITNIDVSRPLHSITRFKPIAASDVIFSSEPQKIDIIVIINVTRNKPTECSAFASDTQTGAYAVDGDYSTASLWMSPNTPGPHWIIVDLEDFYAINAIGLWRAYNAAHLMPKFTLQAWLDGDWVDVFSEDDAPAVPDVTVVYYKEFESVTTDRIRLFFPVLNPDEGYRVRLIELEVYSITKY